MTAWATEDGIITAVCMYVCMCVCVCGGGVGG